MKTTSQTDAAAGRGQRARATTAALAMTVTALCGAGADAGPQRTWTGLQVAPENRCSRYDPEDYRHTQRVEVEIIEQLGGIWSPYTNERFANRRQTDIEHIIAKSEAHDSGLCAASQATRSAFANDLLNLTLAAPDLNRREKRARDAAEWLPQYNQCWFAERVVAVRQKYKLTIDRAEAAALQRVRQHCGIRQP